MRAPRLLGLGLVLAACAAPSAHAADGRIIPDGVSAGGVDLSLLTVDEATARLAADPALGAALRQDLVLGAAGVAWRLPVARLALTFDAAKTADRASQVPTSVTDDGTPIPVAVPLAVTYSRAAVHAFVARVAAGSYRSGRDARLRITLEHMLVRRSIVGHRLDKRAATRAIDAALTGAARRLHQRLLAIEPRRSTRDLRRAYGTVITVDREHFRLRLFKGLRIAKRYPIAVGMAGLDTPAGLYRIHDKQVNPAWYVPRSAWAGSLQGQTIPGGAPDNPLKARWLGIANGIGIHGTAEDWSIGSRASHGCIRMHVSDVIDLYPRVPVGTSVLIG